MAMTLMAESRNEHVVQAHQHLQAAVQREPGNLGYRISRTARLPGRPTAASWP